MLKLLSGLQQWRAKRKEKGVIVADKAINSGASMGLAATDNAWYARA